MAKQTTKKTTKAAAKKQQPRVQQGFQLKTKDGKILNFTQRPNTIYLQHELIPFVVGLQQSRDKFLTDGAINWSLIQGYEQKAEDNRLGRTQLLQMLGNEDATAEEKAGYEAEIRGLDERYDALMANYKADYPAWREKGKKETLEKLGQAEYMMQPGKLKEFFSIVLEGDGIEQLDYENDTELLSFFWQLYIHFFT